jgi:hypothetical protein
MPTISANTFYEYTIGMLGSFSGGTAPTGSTVPHPVATTAEGDNSIVDLSAVTLGGFDGLNN